MSDQGELGPCIVCGRQTMHQCDHVQGSGAPPWVCATHRHAIHLACLLRGESIAPQWLEDDVLLLAHDDPDNVTAEALRSGYRRGSTRGSPCPV